MPELLKAARVPHDWWTIDLCFWPDAWAATEDCKKYVDGLIAKYGGVPGRMSKELRVGMIGYGFMGRAHSNAYKRLNDFFPVEHRPVLKAVCARNPEKAKQFADNWGYERVETRLAQSRGSSRYRSDRHRLAERHALRDRDRCGQSRQDDCLREAAGDGRASRPKRW